MNLAEIWRRLTTNRHARTLEAELARERAANAEQGTEITRLRAENRALLNSILGIAGVPPLPATEADLADVHASPSSGTGVRRKAALGNDACAPLLSHNPPDLGSSVPSHQMNAGGQAEACPTEDSPDTPAGDVRTAGVSSAPFSSPYSGTGTPACAPSLGRNPPDLGSRTTSRPHANQTPHVAAPTRRRSWPQIHRLLEFESAQKEKPTPDPLPPAHQ